MLIGGVILLRTLIHQIVLGSQSKQNISDASKTNILVFASILYHLFMKGWRKLPYSFSNQEHLLEDEMVKPRDPLFSGTNPLLFKKFLCDLTT